MNEPTLRLDKWLWYARFFKTRSLATGYCNSGRLRIGGEIISKAHHKVHPGDILTFPQGRYIRVVKILALAARRGPAPEARLLYEDLCPPRPDARLPPDIAPQSGRDFGRDPGSGRPTKRDRRELEKLRGGG